MVAQISLVVPGRDTLNALSTRLQQREEDQTANLNSKTLQTLGIKKQQQPLPTS